jgi:hypothetical protein
LTVDLSERNLPREEWFPIDPLRARSDDQELASISILGQKHDRALGILERDTAKFSPNRAPRE